VGTHASKPAPVLRSSLDNHSGRDFHAPLGSPVFQGDPWDPSALETRPDRWYQPRLAPPVRPGTINSFESKRTNFLPMTDDSNLSSHCSSVSPWAFESAHSCCSLRANRTLRSTISLSAKCTLISRGTFISRRARWPWKSPRLECLRVHNDGQLLVQQKLRLLQSVTNSCHGRRSTLVEIVENIHNALWIHIIGVNEIIQFNSHRRLKERSARRRRLESSRCYNVLQLFSCILTFDIRN
jgi:hypothetical protein